MVCRLTLLGPQQRSEGWSTSAVRKGWESWDCSAWRREGCGETLEQLPILKGGSEERWGQAFYQGLL